MSSNRRRGQRPRITKPNPEAYTYLELFLLCLMYAGWPARNLNKRELAEQIYLGMIREGELDPELPERGKAGYFQMTPPALKSLGYAKKRMPAILAQKLLLTRDHPEWEPVINSKTFEKKGEEREIKYAKKNF